MKKNANDAKNDKHELESPQEEKNLSTTSSSSNNDPKAKKKKKKKKPIIILLDILIVAFIGAGLFLLLKPMYIAWQQKKVIEEMNLVMENEDEDEWGFWVDPNANAVEGEELETFSADNIEIPDYDNTSDTSITTSVNESDTSSATGETSENKAETPEQDNTPVYLELLGKIQIDAIGLDLPVLYGAQTVQLRYGAGWYESSAALGEPGRAALLAHTFMYDNRYFSLIPDLRAGDQIRIEQKDRILYYETYDYKIIPGEDLWNYLIKPDVESEIMLVTCYPRYVWDKRYIVFAKLVDVVNK